MLKTGDQKVSSKNTILKAIKAAGVPARELPFLPHGEEKEDKVVRFTQCLEKLSCTLVRVEDAVEAQAWFQSRHEEGKQYFNGLDKDVHTQARPHAWKDVEGVLLEGQFGVAENGAIWVSENAMPDRVIPFICQHLYLVISASSLVDTMHQAYPKVAQDSYGYGVFISGPSKTADIEQSLVIGAHGPLSLTVLLLA